MSNFYSVFVNPIFKFDRASIDPAFFEKIKGLQENIQSATENEIAVYKIVNSEKQKNLFLERTKSCTSKIIITNKTDLKINNKVHIQIEDQDLLEGIKLLCDWFYPFPSKTKLAAVTGTNGKTTTVNLAMHISCLLGKKAISIGTLGLRTNSGELPTHFSTTTPSYLELRKIFFQYNSYDAIFMEVSSHALAQQRVYKINFDIAAWTSFSQDHLDFHQDMVSYFLEKTKLWKEHLKPNVDFYVPHSQQDIYQKLLDIKKNNDAKLVKTNSLTVEELKTLPAFFHTQFNQDNLQLALAMNHFLWGQYLPLSKVAEIPLPDGRFNTLEFGKKLAIIDYAHTPDAIKNICIAVKKAFSPRTLVVLFGCGGDRDRSKRSLMGQVVCEFAQHIIITSDNPRGEDPNLIIKDILEGVNKNENQVLDIEVDRKKAIYLGLRLLKDNDVFLILGKGHETYQEIKGIKYPFSDKQVVQDFINQNN